MNRSPLKWAGSKAGVMDQLLPYLSGGRRLVEPFVGSGSVFLNTNYQQYLLCDINPDLINFFITATHCLPDLIAMARALFEDGNNPERYYQIRTDFNTWAEPGEKAAMFLYLNRHCFNGLCRYSELSGFNVPFGRYKQPYFPEKELRLFSEKANDTKAVFLCCDFEESIEMAGDGDTIYSDPPYMPETKTAAFTQYHKGGFGQGAHEQLVIALDKAESRGAKIVISNSEASMRSAIYGGYNHSTITANRSISRVDGVSRAVNEIIYYAGV